MTEAYWTAKPYGVICAENPRVLGQMGVVVHPFSLPGGLPAAIEYMLGQGLKPRAIIDKIRYYHQQEIAHEATL